MDFGRLGVIHNLTNSQGALISKIKMFLYLCLNNCNFNTRFKFSGVNDVRFQHDKEFTPENLNRHMLKKTIHRSYDNHFGKKDSNLNSRRSDYIWI